MITAIDTGSNAISCSPGRSENSPCASAELTAVPTSMPTPAPIALPRKPMNTASRLNSENTRPEPMPIAFMRPISRVRSCTLISSVLTMPKLAASRAMIANALRTSTIASMTAVNEPSWSSTVVPVNPASDSAVFRSST